MRLPVRSLALCSALLTSPVGLVCLAACLAACQAQAPGKPTTPSATARPRATVAPPGTAGEARVLGAGDVLVAATLIGKVKLISDRGAGIISNNAGAIIANNGGALISDKGVGLVANNGGGLIGKVKYGVAQAADGQADGGLREAALADAWVEFTDARGRVLQDAGGPIRVQTDKTGAYRFTGKLPAENLVVRVAVHAGGALPGGELRALLPNPGGAQVAATLDVDTPATLGAAYVLDTYVKGDPAVLARLPAAETAALARDMGLALRAAKAAPAYETGALVEAVEALKAESTSLAATLEQIEALLLLGQADLGTGQAATRVPLTMPVAVVGDPDGSLVVAEGYFGRVRRVAAGTGTVSMVAAAGRESELGYGLPQVLDLQRGPDGKLYAIDESREQVLRLDDGAPVAIAGTGVGGHGAAGGPATGTPLYPAAIAWDAAGLLHVAERAEGAGMRSRVLTVDAAGTLAEVPTPEAGWATGSAAALAIAPDGTIYVALEDEVLTGELRARNGRVMRKRPGEGWDVFADGLQFGPEASLAIGAGGGLLVAEDEGHRIARLAPDGTRTPLAGTGRGGYAGDGGPATAAQLNQPTGLFAFADGRIAFADRGSALVRLIDAQGTISTVAGRYGLFEQGAGRAFAVNNPTGLAIDGEGRLIVAEGSSHTLKRFDGTSLTLFGGTERGFGGDGGPATAARFDTPSGLGFGGGALWVADYMNQRIRKIDGQGVVTTVAGLDPERTARPVVDRPVVPAATSIYRPIGLAVGPDGLPAFSVSNMHQVLKLRADGQIAVLAGQPLSPTGEKASGDTGDGGPATAARLRGPTGLAYGPDGTLYIADFGNCRVRQVKPDGTIRPFAGTGFAGLLDPAALTAGTASTVALALPIAMAVDPAGNVYVAEVGTRNARESIGVSAENDALVKALPQLPARIRRIAPDGAVTIVAGPGGKVMTDPDADGALALPTALVIRPDGSLVVADAGTNQVHLIPKEAL